jgi:predicted dehydrogenase
MNARRSALRVGLLGYGFAGKTFHAPLIQATPGLELTAVASSNAAKVQQDFPQLEVIADPLRLLSHDGIDLIVIATPNDTHAPLAGEAIRAGKHVVVDKPFALDLAEARALATLADESGQLLSVFQNRRWDSDFLAVKRAIDHGLIGTVAHFESHIDRFRPAPRPRWREQAGPGAGICYDLGPHLIDQALQLFGLPERVGARLAIQRAGGETDDWVHILLDYGSPQVILHASMLVAGGVPRFIVHGDRGSMIKHRPDQQEAQLLAGMQPGASGWGVDSDDLVIFDGDASQRHITAPVGDYRHYYAGVRDAILGKAANPVSTAQAVAVMAVLDAAIASSRNGCPVAPDLTAEERATWQRQP